MNAKRCECGGPLQVASFDEAVRLTGFGRFHYETILACFLSILVVGFQNGLSAYVLPAAQCELRLTSFQMGLLNVAFLAGGIVSCFLWGLLADMYGRRRVLIGSHLANGTVTVICSLCPYTGSIVACRFLNGFLVGAPGSVIFAYFAEFQPPNFRRKTSSCCGLFFTFSWLLLPLLAYCILPLDVNYQLGNVLTVTAWRCFMIVTAVPEILVGLWFVRMPESPKYYAAVGKMDECLAVLRRMYTTNTGKDFASYPVKYLKNSEKKPEENVFEYEEGVLRMLKSVISQIRILFKPPLLSATVLTCGIMFANMFGMFGLGMWLPELFIRFERYNSLHPGATVSVKELASLNQDRENVSATCKPFFEDSVITSTVAMAVTSLGFNLASCLLTGLVNIRTVTMVAMLLGGVSAASIYWLTNSLENLIVSCIFQATMITSNMTATGIGVELFPTTVSGIAVCFILFLGRIGAVSSNFLFGYLVDSYCDIAIFIVAVVVLIGGLLCLAVPTSTEKSYVSAEEGPNGVAVISVS